MIFSPLALRGEGPGVRGFASIIINGFWTGAGGSPHPQPLSPEGERRGKGQASAARCLEGQIFVTRLPVHQILYDNRRVASFI